MRTATTGMRAHIGIVLLALFLWIFVNPSHSRGEELKIASASALNFAMKELASEFEKKTGFHVTPTFGSSGSLFSQIQNGTASFDLYFSANVEFPKQLEDSGLALPGSLHKYAVGRLVMWMPATSSLAIEQVGMDALLEPSIKKIAISNPKHAPYGRAAVAALDHFKLYDRVKDKLVIAENVLHVARMVESGAADVGILALSLAKEPSMKLAGKYWEVPPDAYPVLEQGAVVLKGSKHEKEAKAFFAFVQTEYGQEIMQRYGFLPASANVAQKR